MSTQASNLSSELAALANEYRDLGPRLAEAARNLEVAGQPPAEDTIALVQTARQRFLECREATLRLAAAEKFPSLPSPDQLASVPDLEKLIQGVVDLCAEREKQEQQRKMLDKAAAVLERVLAISHRDGIDFQPLHECQDRAREIKKSLEYGQAEVNLPTYQDLAAGSHPFCDLLVLIEHHSDIDDARWEELESVITRSFSKSLTIAATRGKLIVGAPPKPAQPPAAAPAAPTLTPSLLSRSAKDTMEAPALGNDAHAGTITMDDGRRSAKTYSDERTEMELDLPEERRTQAAVAEEEEPVAEAEPEPEEPEDEPVAAEAESEEDAETQRRPLPDDVWHRSPLTAQQEAEILAPGSGVAILFGAHIAGLDDVERFLELACHDGRIITLDSATDRSSFLRELDGLLEDRPDGMILVVVPVQVPWSEDWILRALEQVKRKASARKMTRVLFLADPEAAWSWVRMDDDQRGQMRRDGLVELSLIPWSNAALRRWLQDVGLSDSDPYICERIARVTGSWGALIHQLGYRCRTAPEEWADRLADFERELTSGAEWEDRLGLVQPAHAVLKTMAAMTQPVSSDKVAAKMEGTPRERVDTVLRWADMINYVQRSGHQMWTLDPVVRQVVLQND